jgi:hypothetical protein
MQRPTGVTILAVLEFVGGALGILGGCGAIGLGGLIGAGVAGDNPAAAGMAGVLGVGIGVVLLVLSVIGILIGYGLWTLKKWAWNAARILSIVNIVFGILSIVGGITAGQDAGSTILGNAVGIAINVFIVYYLNKPEVKAAFA